MSQYKKNVILTNYPTFLTSVGFVSISPRPPVKMSINFLDGLYLSLSEYIVLGCMGGQFSLYGHYHSGINSCWGTDKVRVGVLHPIQHTGLYWDIKLRFYIERPPVNHICYHMELE